MEFKQKYGYSKDPIDAWFDITTRLDIDLGWTFNMDFDKDYFNRITEYDDVMEGLTLFDDYIAKEFGPAMKSYRQELVDFKYSLENVDPDDLSREEWVLLTQQIENGIT